MPTTDPRLDPIEDQLSTLIHQLEPPTPSTGPGRPRAVPWLCVWGALLVCVLRGATSQLAIWRRLTASGLWDYPRFACSDQAVYDYLADAPATTMEDLFLAISAQVRAQVAPWVPSDLAPFASGVSALDQTTLDQVARSLPALRTVPAGDATLFPGKLTAVFDLRAQTWHAVHYETRPQQNENYDLTTTVADWFAPRSLLVMDLGYFSFAWLDWLSQHNLFWVERERQQTSYRVAHTWYQTDQVTDQLIWLGAYRADRAGYLVRRVAVRDGTLTLVYLTNVLFPWVFPPPAIVQVYEHRWDIELAFNLVKRHLHLHLIWSAKPTVVLHQVWAVLTIAQILLGLRWEVAGRAACPLEEVSMALLIREMPEYVRLGQDPIAVWVERGRAARYIRPSTRRHREVWDAVPARPAMAPWPADLELVRPARYAHRQGQHAGPEGPLRFTAPHPSAPWFADEAAPHRPSPHCLE